MDAELEAAKKVEAGAELEAAKKVEAKKVEVDLTLEVMEETTKTEDLTVEVIQVPATEMTEILSNIPHVGGLNGAQAQNQEKKFIWTFLGAAELQTDLSTDSTDVVHLDALKAEQYFMVLPDRGWGDHANDKHLRMSKALLQLLNLSEHGSELNTENMEYCEFACIPADHGIRGSEWRGGIITFINPSDSKLTVANVDEEQVFHCGPWSMFTVDEETAKRLQVRPVNKARLYIVLGCTKGERSIGSPNVPPPSNPKIALFKPKEAAKKVETGKTRAKRREIETLQVDKGDASNKQANRDAQTNGAAMRWLKDHYNMP